MKHTFFALFVGLIALTLGTLVPSTVHSQGDFVVISVLRSLDLGNTGEQPQRDYFVNMGSSQGIREGTVLEVLRKTPSYDLNSQTLYRDITFPIARLKVIHSESNIAIARLEKMLPPEKTPVIVPNSVMVGDAVRLAQ